MGHRATVTFDLLGVPGPTVVALYYDIGAHWGGVTSRAPVELAGWALLMATIAVAFLAVVVGLGIRIIRRSRSSTASGSVDEASV